MSPVRLIILLVAAGAAIAAVFLVRSVQAPSSANAAAAVSERLAVPVKQVLVARRDIPVGKMVVVDDLRWQDWPENSPSASFIEHKSSPQALQQAVGAIARVSMVEGEPLTSGKFVQPGDASFMAALLTPGMRAVGVEIAPESAAGGFILPNDRVDVMMTRELDTEGKSSGMSAVRTDMILANVRVLAIDANYGPPTTQVEGKDASGAQGAVMVGSRATLELSQVDATLLGSADKAGDISLALRSVTDQLGQTSGATPTGRVYRDGVTETASGVRIYRYGSEADLATPAS
jgi:pilus assembly protein CpaB